MKYNYNSINAAEKKYFYYETSVNIKTCFVSKGEKCLVSTDTEVDRVKRSKHATKVRRTFNEQKKTVFIFLKDLNSFSSHLGEGRLVVFVPLQFKLHVAGVEQTCKKER